jgi:aromatic-L-amino-acid decarboxylase
VRPLLEPVADADSAIVDPHKWLATGVGVGAAYVRDGAVLHRAFQEGESAYLEGTFTGGADGADPLSQFEDLGGPWADLAVELSAPPRGPAVWAVLREVGREGVRARVQRHRRYARHVAERARAHPRLELLDEPQLSIACFRYRPADASVDVDALTARLLQRLRRETPYVPSSTVVHGRLALRPCYINPRTTLAEVDGLVDAVIRLGDCETGLAGPVDRPQPAVSS